MQMSRWKKNLHFVGTHGTQKAEDFSMELLLQNLIFKKTVLHLSKHINKYLLDAFCLCTLLQKTGLLLHFSASAFLPVKNTNKKIKISIVEVTLISVFRRIINAN